MDKLCFECRKPFRQFTTLQNRCGECAYKKAFEIRTASNAIWLKREKSRTRTKWSKAKKKWIKNNPAIDGFWYCHYCGIPLTIENDLLEMGVQYLTLDHMNARSSRPDLKYEQDNLVPCCILDNDRKGSIDYEDYCEQYYPHLLVDTAGK